MRISAKAGEQILEVEVERQDGGYRVKIGDEEQLVEAHKLEGDFYSIIVDDRSYEVSVESRDDGYRVRHGAAERLVSLSDPSRRAREMLLDAGGPEEIKTQMPGKIARLLVAVGDEVDAGQGVVVVEAMKMENELTTRKAGTVKSIHVAPNQPVEGGTTLLVIE